MRAADSASRSIWKVRSKTLLLLTVRAVVYAPAGGVHVVVTVVTLLWSCGGAWLAWRAVPSLTHANIDTHPLALCESTQLLPPSLCWTPRWCTDRTSWWTWLVPVVQLACRRQAFVCSTKKVYTRCIEQTPALRVLPQRYKVAR